MILYKKAFYRIISKEINASIRYSDRLFYINNRKDQSFLFEELDCALKQQVSLDEVTENDFLEKESTSVILNGTFNYGVDIQCILEALRKKIRRNTRVTVILYNPVWSSLFKFAGKLGLIKGKAPETFLTDDDLRDLCKLTGHEVVRIRPSCFFPVYLFGLGEFFNKLLAATPFLRKICLTYIITLRPMIETSKEEIFLSIIIPARNEKGNIENAIVRLPKFDFNYEVIFVEGHSKDGTWDEIQRISEKYDNQLRIVTGQQKGKGKADAVEEGVRLSQGNLITILDADLTMPPEKLGIYVDAFLKSKADFINGSRLLYPMEGNAMKFLNKIGNYFFAKALSFVLEARLSDSLCGTKLFSRKDYDRFQKWKVDFKSNDPFGDFDLLFPSAVLGLGVINIPIKYADRSYGETNISRFRHGFMLLKMTLVGLVRIRIRL